MFRKLPNSTLNSSISGKIIFIVVTRESERILYIKLFTNSVMICWHFINYNKRCCGVVPIETASNSLQFKTSFTGRVFRHFYYAMYRYRSEILVQTIQLVSEFNCLLKERFADYLQFCFNLVNLNINHLEDNSTSAH